MEEETIRTKTTFDTVTQKHQLEIIKAAIPYINNSEQKLVSVYVKVSELMDTVTIFQKPESSVGICSTGDNEGGILNMLNDIKAVCTSKEKETINMVINYMNAFQLYNSYQDTYSDTENTYNENSSSNMFDNLKDLLTPEQQKMFETYSVMFNS
ncbi:MAG: hypothetical protein ACERKZ_19285 [Lachnotalea sp.]